MENINVGIIGFNGFLGSNIAINKKEFLGFNSKNINEIKNFEFENLFITAPSGIKFQANKNPLEDFLSVKELTKAIENIKAKRVILTSSSYVYHNKTKVDEREILNPILCDHYGRHRALFENYIYNNFNAFILRIPTVYAPNMRKNFIFDLIKKDFRFLPNPNSTFQFYSAENLNNDINKMVENNIKILNCVSEPISANEIYQNLLDVSEYDKVINEDSIEKNLIEKHDILSLHASLWKNKNNYLTSKNEIINDLKSLKDRIINK